MRIFNSLLVAATLLFSTKGMASRPSTFIKTDSGMVSEAQANPEEADQALKVLSRSNTFYFGNPTDVVKLLNDLANNSRWTFSQRLIELSPVSKAISVRLMARESFVPTMYQFVVLHEKDRFK